MLTTVAILREASARYDPSTAVFAAGPRVDSPDRIGQQRVRGVTTRASGGHGGRTASGRRGAAAAEPRPPRERAGNQRAVPHQPTADAAPAAPTARWTFLTNHSHVLILLSQDPTLVLREVAARVGITERAVQRIITDLEEAGFLERERQGRRNRYRIRGQQPLRHPIESHHTVGELIALVAKS